MNISFPKIFFEVHARLPREGPGDNESTTKAYRMLRDLPENPRVLDVGCGPGMQTIELAKLSKGKIDALDYFPRFLEQLRKKAEQERVAQNINTVICDMFKLNYENHTFNLVWSEGSIYIIGFERGLREWKKLLAPKGYIVASHIAWLKPNPPQELRTYWQENYKEISTIQTNLETARKTGYQIVGYFALPEKSWWENYYKPIEEKLPTLRSKYQDDEEALAFLKSEELEINMFRKYSNYYGYVFYVMQTKN
jgi:ubiquinone/menaquinone biosynthesis C-methylase UbiE